MNATEVDSDLHVDAATEQAVRRRLAALAERATVAPDAWETLSARTTGGADSPPRPGHARRGRRRLLAAAAILLVLVGSVVVDERDADDGRVTTDDAPPTTVDDQKDFDERRPDDDRANERPAPGGDPAGVAPGVSPSTDDDGHSEAAGSVGPGGPGDGSVSAPGPSADATTTTAPTTTAPTTTTTLPPPQRTPGDVTVTTSSGFSVEILVEDGGGPDPIYIHWLRRTDSPHGGGGSSSWAFPDDGYLPFLVTVVGTQYRETPAGSGNWVATEPRGRQCVGFHHTRGDARITPHEFVFGLVGADVSEVRVVMGDGRTYDATPSSRVVGDFHAFLVETEGTVARVDGFDGSGTLLNAAPAVVSSSGTISGSVACSVEVPGREPPPF